MESLASVSSVKTDRFTAKTSPEVSKVGALFKQFAHHFAVMKVWRDQNLPSYFYRLILHVYTNDNDYDKKVVEAWKKDPLEALETIPLGDTTEEQTYHQKRQLFLDSLLELGEIYFPEGKYTEKLKNLAKERNEGVSKAKSRLPKGYSDPFLSHLEKFFSEHQTHPLSEWVVTYAQGIISSNEYCVTKFNPWTYLSREVLRQLRVIAESYKMIELLLELEALPQEEERFKKALKEFLDGTLKYEKKSLTILSDLLQPYLLKVNPSTLTYKIALSFFYPLDVSTE